MKSCYIILVSLIVAVGCMSNQELLIPQQATVTATSIAKKMPDFPVGRKHLDYEQLQQVDEKITLAENNHRLITTAAEVGLITPTARLDAGVGTANLSTKLNVVLDAPGDDYCSSCDKHLADEVKCTPDADAQPYYGYSYIDIDGQRYKLPDGTSVDDFFDICLPQLKKQKVVKKRKVKKVAHKKKKVAKQKIHLLGQELLDNYANSSAVQRMVNQMRLNAIRCLSPKNRKVCRANPPPDQKAARKSTGYCFKYVKMGLLAGGLAKSYLPGVAAKNSGKALKRAGFINLKDDPRFAGLTSLTAPKGAVLVYSGGKYGHIEVKASDNEYISDFNASGPLDQRTSARKLIGIYVKKM